MAAVAWTVEALQSLDGIADYIARDQPANADVFVARVFDAVERLLQFPRLGRVVPEFDRDDLREIVFQNYRIVYRLDGEAVTIVTVVHGAMDVTAEPPRLGY